MRPHKTQRQVQSLGVLESRRFHISESKVDAIMSLLRSDLYSNKILALIREYSGNAWDAHQRAGIEHVPIYVHLPTERDPTLIIRDYGAGLSEEDVYLKMGGYGETDKDLTDDEIGAFGIGGKSGFAYNDTYTITSHHGGMKKVYVAVIDESNIGELTKLYEEPSYETGIEIKVPARPKDMGRFHNTAQEFYKFFYPQPVINTIIPEVSGQGYDSGYVTRARVGWTAVVGCVGYPIDPDQVLVDVDEDLVPDMGADPNETYKKIRTFLQKGNGGLYFDIGEVSISGSRESLQYTSITREAITRKVSALFSEVIREIERVRTDLSWWERRHSVRQAAKSMGVELLKHPLLKGKVNIIPDPAEEKAKQEKLLAQDGKVPVKQPVAPDDVAFDPGPNFRLYKLETRHTKDVVRTYPDHGILVDERTQIIVEDRKPRTMRGYFPGVTSWSNLPPTYWVRPKDGVKIEAVLRDLDARLADAKLTGVPIQRLSHMAYHPVSGGSRDAKHKAQGFVLTGFRSSFWRRNHKASENWTVATEAATADDVYVCIHRFFVNDDENWFAEAKEALAFAKDNGFHVPKVFGYKDSDSKPFDSSTTLAKPFDEWRAEIQEKVLEKDRQRLIFSLYAEKRYYASPFTYHDEKSRECLAYAARRLPPDHWLLKLIQEWEEGVRLYYSKHRMRLDNPQREEYARREYLKENWPAIVSHRDSWDRSKLRKSYPMLTHYYQFDAGEYKRIIDYVRTVDFYDHAHRPVTYAQDQED